MSVLPTLGRRTCLGSGGRAGSATPYIRGSDLEGMGALPSGVAWSIDIGSSRLRRPPGVGDLRRDGCASQYARTGAGIPTRSQMALGDARCGWRIGQRDVVGVCGIPGVSSLAGDGRELATRLCSRVPCSRCVFLRPCGRVRGRWRRCNRRRGRLVCLGGRGGGGLRIGRGFLSRRWVRRGRVCRGGVVEAFAEEAAGGEDEAFCGFWRAEDLLCGLSFSGAHAAAEDGDVLGELFESSSEEFQVITSFGEH